MTDSRIPAGLSPNRTAVLRYALAEIGTHEATGHNDGAIEKYVPAGMRGKGLPWCCFFGGYVWEQALGRHPYGHRIGSCWALYEAAKLLHELHTASDAALYTPQPGDCGIILHDDDGNPDTQSPGHFVFVLRVSEDGRTICTVEGNYHNRVGIAQRAVDSFAGFVNPYQRGCGEGTVRGWARGLIPAPHEGPNYGATR